MTIPEILKELEPYTGRFPKNAMKAAIEQREAITPELLRVVAAVAENPGDFARNQDYMLHVFAVFLLAQFREQRAYPLIIKLVSAPGELPFDLLGDTVTEGLCQILASVYDGDPAPLQGLIESKDINGFVRDAAIRAFLVLENAGLMKRETVVDYFRSLFHGKLEPEHSYAWDSLVCAVADLPAPELLEEVRQAYAAGLVDSMVADLPGLERDIASPVRHRDDRRTLITDAIAEMGWWAAFHPEPSSPKKAPTTDTRAMAVTPAASQPYTPEESYVAPQPYIREAKIGRNEPCPCGSGLKYKKCCGKG